MFQNASSLHYFQFHIKRGIKITSYLIVIKVLFLFIHLHILATALVSFGL